MIKHTDVYIAKFLKYNHKSLPEYSEPKLFKLKLNTLNGFLDVQSYGDDVTNMRKTLVDYAMQFEFNEKDLAYIGVTPEGEAYNGQKANYIVNAVLPQNMKAIVMFKKL